LDTPPSSIVPPLAGAQNVHWAVRADGAGVFSLLQRVLGQSGKA
jgi:hypothetical protein